MFNLLRQSLKTGVVTTSYPAAPAAVSPRARGRPRIDWPAWKDARPAAAVCPTGAIAWADAGRRRTATLDLARCIFCGLCADVDPAIRMTNVCECAARSRAALLTRAAYALKSDGTHDGLIAPPDAGTQPAAPLDAVGRALKARAEKLPGRSLHIREVDAGSCNGCEIEIGGLNSPIYDAERFGVHFVASPRHADMLLVTGPVTRNMELALRKTYDAMPGAAPGRGRGRVRVQRRDLRRQLRDARRGGCGDSGRRVCPRLPAQSPRPAARHPDRRRPVARVEEREFVRRDGGRVGRCRPAAPHPG